MSAMKVITGSVCLILLLCLGSKVMGQTASQDYFVTIGVFAKQDNAVRYTAKASKAGFHAQYAINPEKKLYYVYLLQTNEKRKAFAFLIKLRAESDYKDAWVFNGRLGEQPVVEIKQEPVIETVIVKEEPVVVVETPPVVKIDSSTIVKPPPAKKVAKGKFFEFQFLNEETGNEVRGEVHLSESNKAAQYQAFKANELIDLVAPRNAGGTYFLTTIAPGYKALETQINFKDPLTSSSGTGPDGELIIPLTLKRAKRGDYIEFNNVSFYRNSVIMQPQFQVEMDGLADLMKENQNYKVKIHGHCNGNEPRDMILLGTSTKFFETDPGNEKKTGSAKDLTEYRAEAARRYLVSQGITVDRILTKGEGGKMMIYPQTSVYANYNDRIEVEIVRH